MVEEKRFLREAAEEKYRRTHDYNIIAGAYFDQNKERNFVTSREKLGTMQGRAQQYRLPPSIRYGEGNGYNIINQQVHTRAQRLFFCRACATESTNSSGKRGRLDTTHASLRSKAI